MMVQVCLAGWEDLVRGGGGGDLIQILSLKHYDPLQLDHDALVLTLHVRMLPSPAFPR